MESPIDIECPYCAAAPGRRCMDRNGKFYEATNFHGKRTDAYRRATFRAMQAEARNRGRKRPAGRRA